MGRAAVINPFEGIRSAMVTNQLLPNKIVNPSILKGFLSINRGDYCPASWHELCYSDAEVPVGSQRTLLPPLYAAQMLTLADLKESTRVLVLAAGSGYMASVMTFLSHNVFALENHENPYLLSAAENYPIHTLQGQFDKTYESEEPFDVVCIDSGSVEVLHPWVFQYLKEDGTLITLVQPKGMAIGKITAYKKNGTPEEAPSFDGVASPLAEFRKPLSFNF
jgi:protein-L-isoaspartate(D-aspartate) O-methyltransferase